MGRQFSLFSSPDARGVIRHLPMPETPAGWALQTMCPSVRPLPCGCPKIGRLRTVLCCVHHSDIVLCFSPINQDKFSDDDLIAVLECCGCGDLFSVDEDPAA